MRFPKFLSRKPLKNTRPETTLPTPQPEPKSESRPDSKSDSNPEKPETKPESKPENPETKPDKKPKKPIRGGQNLVILGIICTLIAILTTTVGLAIYRLSGDIYLDRSRPGYIPDEAEVEEENESKPEEYDFDKNGKVSAETIDEYLKHLSEEVNAVNSYEKPFDPSALTDERLGITENE